MRDNEEGHREAFEEFCYSNGIAPHPNQGGQLWWECWNAALDAADNAQLESMNQDPIDDESPLDWDDIPF